MLWERRCASRTAEGGRPHVFRPHIFRPHIFFVLVAGGVVLRGIICCGRAHRYNPRFMFWAGQNRFSQWGLLFILWAAHAAALAGGSCSGTLYDATGKPLAGAEIRVRAIAGGRDYRAATSQDGKFAFAEMDAGAYELSVKTADRQAMVAFPLAITSGNSLRIALQLTAAGQIVQMQNPPAPFEAAGAKGSAQASGGEHLSGSEVSSLPLNVRDFSKLLLLAAGTMTDANGAANFTQQFAVNGQRGATTVFAADGFDTTDPEMGGATFSNFNVDAIQEVQSSSGVMPAEIGHGAASFTNVVTKSGTDAIHGSLFEFVRNAAFDARNYFDYRDPTGRRRIPPFARNEFGFTNGGPVVLPGIYDGRGRTFYFGEYQGFRQVLGTTQVIPVPTVAERQGIDTTTYPGDTLTIPVNAAVLPVLSQYPLPNEPAGAFGDRTYAAFSKVVTDTDQFSVRIDHKISEKASLVTRFSLNQVTGPLTNPDQTVIDPSFGVQFFDHQRNAGVHYARVISPRLTSDTSLGYIRSTPFFPTTNHTQPALGFADGLFQGFNAAGGSIFGSYSNLYQLKQDLALVHGAHVFKWGVELRANRDSTIFGTSPNGAYEFSGGPAYSPVFIPSASGTHDIQVGDPLPDSLTGLLTATPYSYSVTAPASVTPVGDKFDEAGVRREAYDFYFQDTWKATKQFTVSYGLRYEVNSRIHEATKRTSGPFFFGPDGKPTGYGDRGATQIVLVNPQPPYDMAWNGWGPRLGLDYGIGAHTVLHAGGAVTTLLPNLWQDNFLTAAIPFVFAPNINALPGVRGSVPQYVCADDAADRVQRPGPADFCDGANPGCSGKHTDRPATLPDRYGCADSGRSGAVADDHGHGEEFRQWIRGQLDGGHRSRFSRLPSERVVRGHHGHPSFARVFSEQLHWGVTWLRAVYAIQCGGAGDRRIRAGSADDQRIAFYVSLAAKQPDEKFGSIGIGIAGELHVFEIDR